MRLRSLVGQEAKQHQFLSGWKEIANYLGKGVRTVQRYERQMGLPIHRPVGKTSPAVVAVEAELDQWLTGPREPVYSLAKRKALKSRTNKLRASFLRIDCDIALTFASVALGATDQEKRRRTTRIAREAYDTILRLKQSTELGEAEEHNLNTDLRRLKSELKTLGQSF